jgi:hypothetical protein
LGECIESAGGIDSFKGSGGAVDNTGQGEPLRRLREVIDGEAPPGREAPASVWMGDAIMNRWWTGVALLAAGLLPGNGWGQQPGVLPTPLGAARIPDPAAVYTGPPLANGPLTTQVAPCGPPENLSLPVNHTSAFQDENWPLECAWWFNFGGQALTRTSFGHLPLFYHDPVNTVDNGGVPNRLQQPLFFLLDANDLDRQTQWGLRGSVGYIFDTRQSIELTGWYMFERSTNRGAVDQNRLNSFFTNAPLGFEGDNGMWLQADVALLTRRQTLGNAELNYRYTSAAVTEPELIIGLRYFDMTDHFNLYTGDDDLSILQTAGPNIGLPDQRRQATLDYGTHNRIVAPQLGFEWTPLGVPFGNPILQAGVNAKGAWGPNFAETSSRLVRGDGFQGFHTNASRVIFSQVYELGAFAEISFLERMRFRAGYQAIWLLGIADAQDQLDFNLRNAQGRRDFTGSQFWHGPQFEFQFLF